MAFDPDAYLAEGGGVEETPSFDPDAYLGIQQPTGPEQSGTSFGEEVSQLGPAFIESIGRPLENMGESFEAIGFTGVANALKDVINEPEGYISASQRFMEPKPDEAQFLGFAWQYTPRAAVEQVGQAILAIGTRAVGAFVGNAVAGPAGAAALGFAGPAIFGAAQVIGPVAKERAMNNGREVPNNEDLVAATLTAIGSGSLDAIGAKYLPGGEKATGKFFKRVASSFVGEGLLTEAPQSVIEQVGATAGTEKGLNINVKQAVGEGLIGGTSAAGLSAVVYPLTKKEEPDPKNKVIRTPEQAEELDIDGKSNEEAISLMGEPADEAQNERITKLKEIEAVIANNETLMTGLEPNVPERTQLDLENKEARKEADKLKAEISKSVGLSLPITTAEQQQIELAKQIAAPAKKEAKLPAMPGIEEQTSEAAYGRETGVYDVFGGVRRKPAPPTAEAPAITPAPVEEVEFAELRNLMERRGQAQGKVKGVKFSKKDEARYNELLPKYRSQLLETITPETDPVVWKDIEGNDIKVSQKGTFYTVENGRVRTGPAFQSEGFIKDVSPQPVSAAVVESNNVPLPEGYTKQGDLYVYQPTPAVSETITTAPEVAPPAAIVEQEPSKVYDETQTRIRGIQAPPAGGEIVLEPEPLAHQGGITKQEKQVGRGAGDREKQRGDAGVAGQVLPRTIPELTEDQAETLRDFISLRKSQGREPNPEQVKRLAEYDARNAGVEVQQGDIVSNIVVGHPLLEAPQPELQNLVPIKIQNKEQLASSIRRTEEVRNKAQSYIGQYQAEQAKAKTATQKKAFAKKFNKSEFDRQRDILDYINNDVMPELDRMEKVAPSKPAPSKLRGQAGGVLIPSREDLIQAGQNIYEAGMEFGAWAKQMVQRFGDAVRQFLADVWEAVSGFPAKLEEMAGYLPGKGERGAVTFGRGEEPKKPAQPAPEKPAEEKITDPVTPDEQTQQLVQQAQEQESLVDSAVKEAGTTVFDVFNRLVNEGKTEDQVAKELGISNYDVRKYKLRADTAILNKMKQNKVKPLAFAPKNPVAEFAEKNLRKYFTKEGWLPKAVFQSWVKRNAVLSREQKEAEFAIKDLYTGIREVFGIPKMEMIVKGLVSVPPEFVQQLNDALAGKIDINTMPEPVREPLVRMRQHIDSMSRQLVDLNVLPDELAAKVTSNLKVYLTRSYKIFTDKNWINKIPTEKLTAARNFLYQQQLKNDLEATIEMADRELRNMLNDWASDAEGIRKRGGKLGAKDLSVMMKRAEVPKVLRDVMGENTNVIFNYANTIGKISRFVADQKFLNEVKAKGAGEFLFTEKDAPKGFNTQIAAEESRTMSPLNGLRTTPEIAKAFEEFGKGYDIRENPGLRLLAWMNAVGKLNLTVGSVLTQMRNLLGQPAFFVFNGHYNWRVIRQEIDAIAKEKGISQEDAKRELVKQAAGQGLVNENAYAGELRTAFQDVGLETFDDIGPDEFTKQFVLTRMYLKGVKSAQELYQKTDEFGKLVGWLNETKRIQRMNKGMDKKTAQSIAAERTRDTYPTYSQSSEALRLFRRQPFVGPFATFFYETFRTSFHNLRYAFEDINGPTPEHKAEGIKRLAGAMATISMGAFGINLLSKLASGIGDEEEEDVRRMLPPWSKDASLAWMPKSKDGTYNFINVSYINPYNALTDPFIAMMSGFARGEKPEEIAVQALGSFLSPFTSEQPITATIADAARNRTSTGKQIYNPQDDIATKTSKIMLHIFGKTFTPGTITRLRERIIPAIQGETVGTRAPAPAKEIAAELTGIRFETLDMKAAFSNKAWEFSRAANESERIFRDVATRRRRVDEQEQVDAYRRSEETRYEIWNDMYRDYMAVRRAGASQGEAVRLMTDIGISKKEAIAISKGRYVPYEISNEVLRRSKLNGNVVPVKQIRAIGKEMPRVLTDIPKTP